MTNDEVTLHYDEVNKLHSQIDYWRGRCKAAESLIFAIDVNRYDEISRDSIRIRRERLQELQDMENEIIK